MKVINKQKFLAELGRLLTFMYEEDRLEALALYEELFDAASDEQALLQLLVSPTRQAVVLARSYQSGSSKLQVQSSSRIDEVLDEDTPAHILAIEELRRSAELSGVIAPVVDDNQMSIFDDAPEAKPESEIAAEPEIAEEVSTVEEAAAVEEAPAVPEESAAPELTDSAIEVAAPAPAEDTAPEAAAEAEAAAAENSAEVTDEVESFLSGFNIEGLELTAESDSVPAPAGVDASDPVKDDFSAPVDAGKPVRKLNPLLLILYLIPAIPVGIAVTALLLVPAVAFLALGAGVIGAGVLLLISAFGSFAMLSDILVVFGWALIVLAFGILFAWLFVWFIGAPIVGFIRALCSLGRKWCSKEVAA